MNFDFSPSEKEIDFNGTFLLDFNGTFAYNSSMYGAKIYSEATTKKELKRIPVPVQAEVIDMDIVGAVRLETLQSFLDLAYEQKMVFSYADYQKKLGKPPVTCMTVHDWLPNMEFDYKCTDKNAYPLDVWMQIVSKPPKLEMTDDSIKMAGIDIHFWSKRFDTDKNALLMDFIMGNMTLSVGQKMNDDLSLGSGMAIEFTEPKIVNRGTHIKEIRDVWRMSWVCEDTKSSWNGLFDGKRYKYIAHSTMQNWGYKIDGKNKAVFVGFQPDPIFYGHYQKYLSN